MTESQWRFLKAIADRLPPDRIVELRLFPTIRQGGAESGVAVVAVDDMAGHLLDAREAPSSAIAAAEGAGDQAEAAAVTSGANGDGGADMARRGPPPENEDTSAASHERHHFIASAGDSSEPSEFDPDATLELEVPQHGDSVAHTLDYGLRGGPSELTDRESLQGVADFADMSGVRRLSDMVTEEIAVPAVPTGQGSTALTSEQEVVLAVELDQGDAQEYEGEPMRSLDDLLDLAIQSEAVAPASGRTSQKRYAVLAARYRLTLKGPDRGKWEFEITHEADAPLDTVERVARGVARRAGDAGEPESFSAPQLRSALAQPWWNSAT